MARHEGGWVKLHRKIEESDIAHNFLLLGLWVTLLKWANWRETKITWRGLPRELERGEILTSVKELAEYGEVDRRTVDKWLNYLVVRDSISVEKSPRGSHFGIIIKIKNYQKYQSIDAEWPHETANEHANETANEGRTYKERKNKRTKEHSNGLHPLAVLWNENVKELGHVLKSKDKRLQLIKEVYQDFSQDQWIEIFKKADESDFLCRKSGGKWKATFDWVIANATRVLEGEFDNAKQSKHQQVVL